jgi:uncharacterized protein (TIGR02118 family)
MPRAPSIVSTNKLKEEGMAKLYALYKHPTDPAAFDRYYYGVHVPIAKKVPGLTSYEVTRGSVAGPGGASTPYYLIAALGFSSAAAINAALASPPGQAAAADLGNFATGGVDLYIADTEVL